LKILLCACAVVLVVPRVQAADATCVPQACLQLEDPLERVACYDRAFGRAGAAQPTSSVTASAPAAVAAPAAAVVPGAIAAAPGSASAASVPASATPAVSAAGSVPAGPVAAAAATARPPASETVDDFGLSEQTRREREGRTALDSISATAAQVSRSGVDRIVVTLDNGQVWMQADPNDDLRINPGDPVTIERAALGSYKLIVPKRGGMRATRIK
jgi:hypothetical protein